MNGVFQIGATGLHAQDRALGIVANNITNMNTPGFKRSGVHFSEMIGPRLPTDPTRRARAAANVGAPGLFGVSSDQSTRVFSDGDLRPTGNPLDVAIQGEGFIELVGADGQALLWRGGTLRVNEEGFLAGVGGLQLKSAISVPEGATAITIDATGEVKAVTPGEQKRDPSAGSTWCWSAISKGSPPRTAASIAPPPRRMSSRPSPANAAGSSCRARSSFPMSS